MYPWSAGNKAASRNGAGHEELDIWIQNLIQSVKPNFERLNEAKSIGVVRTKPKRVAREQTKSLNVEMWRWRGTNTLRTRVLCYRRRYFVLGNISSLAGQME